MAQDSRDSVSKFYLSVSSKARERLMEIDPDYVIYLEEITRTQQAGLVHPGYSKERILSPGGRLPKEWRLVLEVCHDLYQNADFFEQCAVAVDGMRGQPADAAAGAKASYIATSFHVWALALIEKSGSAAKKALRVTLPKTERWQAATEIDRHFNDALQERVEKSKGVRHPALHSSSTYRGRDGEMRPPSSGITEDDGTWEASVTLLSRLNESYEPAHEYIAMRARTSWPADLTTQADQIRLGLQMCLERAAIWIDRGRGPTVHKN